MGVDVVQGDTQFRVMAARVWAFEQVSEQARLGDDWRLIKGAMGDITGIELRGLPGAPCDPNDVVKLTPIVEVDSFVTLCPVPCCSATANGNARR